MLLASLSLGLYNAAGEDNDIARALAVVYTCVALFTLLWGYGSYMYRRKLIRERSGKDFDNVIGPLVVCLGLAVALCLNFGFKVCDGLHVVLLGVVRRANGCACSTALSRTSTITIITMPPLTSSRRTNALSCCGSLRVLCEKSLQYKPPLNALVI